MDALTTYLILFICCLFSLIYTTLHFIHSNKDNFYTFMYLLVISLFVGKLYNLIFELSGGDSNLFTLGDLGNVSGFLFVSYALLKLYEDKLIPSNKANKIKALIMPVLIILMYIILLVNHLEINHMILPTMYLVSSSLCSYLCLRVILDTKKTNNSYKSYCPLLAIIILINILSLFAELFWIINSEIMLIIYEIITIITYILLPITLERGRRKCL